MSNKKPYLVYFYLKGWYKLLILVLIAPSCVTKIKIKKDVKKVNIQEIQLPKDDSKTAIQLNALVKNNELKFNTFSAKIETEAIIDETKNSFISNVRIKKDSAIWISISPAMGIEALRVLLTTDTVLFIDRINHKYFAGNYSYLNKLLNTEVDYEMLQNLLVGNAIDYYQDERLTVTRDLLNKLYVLSSIKKRTKIKKVLKDAIEHTEPIEILWIIPDKYKVNKIYLEDVYNKRTFQVTYDGFYSIDSLQILPSKANYEIRAKKNIFVELNYVRISINEKLEFPFKIPEKYEMLNKNDEE
jgi:hypothetical protein